jgi:hypothetical protein
MEDSLELTIIRPFKPIQIDLVRAIIHINKEIKLKTKIKSDRTIIADIRHNRQNKTAGIGNR